VTQDRDSGCARSRGSRWHALELSDGPRLGIGTLAREQRMLLTVEQGVLEGGGEVGKATAQSDRPRRPGRIFGAGQGFAKARERVYGLGAGEEFERVEGLVRKR